MLVTITSTAQRATDLGYLLHKHPDHVQSFSLPFGTATVFYPEADEDRTTAALQVTVDPIALVRRRGQRRAPAGLASYVNDRPYAAGSMLSVAIGRVFGSALKGQCKERPELTEDRLPLTVHIPALAARPTGDVASPAELVTRLFQPLGWQVDAAESPLAEGFDWGPSPYVDVTLSGRFRLAEALSHLYLLLPVLDDSKHYQPSADEVDKLIHRGEGWLATHPDRTLVTARYLSSRRAWIEDATTRLESVDELVIASVPVDDESTAAQPPTPLRLLRLETVLGVLREVGAHTVADIGCGEGFYLRAMLSDPTFTRIVGIDVSARELERAQRRLRLGQLPERRLERIALRQSSVTYVDDQLSGLDAILLVEVLEHIDPERHPSLENAVFGAAKPRNVILTTPNVEYNAVYGLAAGQLRHPDHRFELTRDEFEVWASRVAEEYGYQVEFRAVGEPDPRLGPPTQLALFGRIEKGGDDA